MATTQRGINIPVSGQFQDGDDIVDALIAQGLSVDSAIGSAIAAAVNEANNYTDEAIENIDGGGVTDHGALTGLTDDDHPQYHNDARGDARYYTKTQVDDALSGKADTGHTHSAGDVSGLATVATSGSYDDLDDKPSIPSPPGSGEVTKAHGQFLNGTTDGLGGTSPSDRVKAEWRDGICIVHIDIKHPSGTVGAAVTFTSTDMPAPPNLVESSIGPGSAWIHAGTKIVEVDLPANQRMNGNLIYFYEV